MNKEIDEFLQSEVKKGTIVGANVLLLKEGKEIVYSQAGYANRENKIAYKRDTIVRLYSMSKPITAVAAMILIDRGQLSLGDEVRKYLPAFCDLDVYENGEKHKVTRQMYIRDLMNMTAGLCYPEPGDNEALSNITAFFNEINDKLYTEEEMTTLEVANGLAGCGLTMEPGTRWHYGTCADVLGAVIEVIANMRLGDFLEKEIFKPLGMRDTGFFVPKNKVDRMAEVYAYTDKKKNGSINDKCTSNEALSVEHTQNLGIKYEQNGNRPKFESGGAGLFSTIDDYSKFATMLINNGKFNGKRILSKAAVKRLTTGAVNPWMTDGIAQEWDAMAGFTYGNLLRHCIAPENTFYNAYKGEYGWDGWLGCYFSNSPENKVTTLITFQICDTGTIDITMKLRNLLAKYV